MKLVIITIAAALCATTLSGAANPKKERREAPYQSADLAIDLLDVPDPDAAKRVETVDAEEVRVLYHTLLRMSYSDLARSSLFKDIPALSRAFAWRSAAYESAAINVAKLLQPDARDDSKR